MTLIAKSVNRLANTLHNATQYEDRELFDLKLRLRTRTFRKVPDYDDAWFLALALRSKTLFDVGANVGYDAVLCLAAAGVQRVVLVEANPKALVIAAENLILNNLGSQAIFVCAFAGDTADQKVTFWTDGAGAAGSMHAKHAKTASAHGTSIEVPTITLDALVEKHGFSPDLVKCDVEGAESKVLRGSANLAGRGQTRFIVEMHSNPDLPMAENAELVLRWCREVGYSAWYLAEKTLLESPKPIADRGRCHLLLQPAAWEFPKWLLHLRQGASLKEAIQQNE